MIGASLNYDIARMGRDLANVHEQRDLAFEDNRVVDSFGSMHVWMSCFTHVG